MKKKPPNSSLSTTHSKSSSFHSSTQRIPPIKTFINKNVNKKSKDKVQNEVTSPAKRTSIYRGVTKHKSTGRFEAHLWDKDAWTNQKKKKGRQIYLGAYENEELAAHAYDLAALKYWGPATALNFPVRLYIKQIEEMFGLTKEEYVATLKRKSSGFSRGVSKYRGVAKHHSKGRWEARIGRIEGNRYQYLGTFGSEKEAAIAYDLAAIRLRGTSAVTNFDISKYKHLLKQDHYEYGTLPQIFDEKEEDKYQNQNQEEWGKQDGEMNVMPKTIESFSNLDLGKDVMVDFMNVYKYKPREPCSSCLNAEEFPKLNFPNDGPYENSEEFPMENVHNDGPHENAGELAPLFNEIDNNIENYMNVNYDSLFPLVNDLHDLHDIDINMLLNEQPYEKYELNQYEKMDDDFMQMATMNPCYDLNQDITLDKEYHTGDEVSDLVEKEAKEKENARFMLDGKGCNIDEASDLVKEKRNKTAASLSSPSSSTTSAYYILQNFSKF